MRKDEILASSTDMELSDIWDSWVETNADTVTGNQMREKYDDLISLRSEARKEVIREAVRKTGVTAIVEWIDRVLKVVNHHTIDDMYLSLPK
jgi:hypothetical protein